MRSTVYHLDNLRFVSTVLCSFIRVTNCLLFPHVYDYKVIIHFASDPRAPSDLRHCDKYLCSQHPRYDTQCIQICPIPPPAVITSLFLTFNEFISDWYSTVAQLHTFTSAFLCFWQILCKLFSVSHLDAGKFFLTPFATGPKAHCTKTDKEKAFVWEYASWSACHQHGSVSVMGKCLFTKGKWWFTARRHCN